MMLLLLLLLCVVAAAAVAVVLDIQQPGCQDEIGFCSHPLRSASGYVFSELVAEFCLSFVFELVLLRLVYLS